MSEDNLSLISAATGIAKSVTDTAGDLLKKMLGKPCAIAGEMIADELYLWQWKRRIAIVKRVSERLERDKIAARILPPDFLIPVLEAIGCVDDDDLCGFRANLIC